MEIVLNGNVHTIEKNPSISALLIELNITSKRLAVEVNEEIVPRSQFDSYILSTGDKVEIVHAIGGG